MLGGYRVTWLQTALIFTGRTNPFLKCSFFDEVFLYGDVLQLYTSSNFTSECHFFYLCFSICIRCLYFAVGPRCVCNKAQFGTGLCTYLYNNGSDVWRTVSLRHKCVAYEAAHPCCRTLPNGDRPSCSDASDPSSTRQLSALTTENTVTLNQRRSSLGLSFELHFNTA